MTELLTATQMRITEQAAIMSGEVTGLDLMERAGQGVVEAIFEQWPEFADAPHRAVVLCGPGNNGGDGFVIARLLKECGWDVEVFLYGDAESLPPDARVNYDRCKVVKSLVDAAFDGWPNEQSGISLVVDSIFGTGLSRPFLTCRHMAISLKNCATLAETSGGFPKVVAVDVPSGLCTDSGKWLGGGQPTDFANIANLTVSFHRKKTGHVLADGPGYCGRVVIKPIGLQVSPQLRVGVQLPPRGTAGGCPAVPPDEVVRLIGATTHDLAKLNSCHKFFHGHALILSGGPGKTGAARLAARGALRVGSGLVTIGVPPSAQLEVANQVTSIMQTRVPDAAGLAEALQDARVNAICLGPGLGLGRARDLVPVALDTGLATVLDADALSAFQDAPDVLFKMLHSKCVLTPHGGEFHRLFPDIAAKFAALPTKGPAYSKVDATREAAAQAGCVVLFKGPDTVITAPDGRCGVHAAVHDRAAPWLATAGSGDVLAGFIAGLLARGFSPMMAAETAAWLHVECARTFGPGLIAEDLPEMLPQVFRDLGI
ncbi:MAG: NAD(P)H-hydrate dehydratase [Rhodobacteraceae bacterium]|nr:NAD(P)H-hydrate dehydratase [Paracoccaceae bacterium]